MNKTNTPKGNKKIINDIMPMIIGEAVVALLVCLGFGILDMLGLYNFDARIISGAALGAVVMIANYAFLTLSVDRAMNQFVTLRGNKEMDEEEAQQFAKENSAVVQNAIKSSFTLRTVSIFAALVLAFILDWFNPLATAIPLFAFRPLLVVVDAVMKKNDPTPDPNKFIKYDYEDENKNEKESD